LEVRLIAVDYLAGYEVNFDDIRLNAYPDPLAPSPYDGEFVYPGDMELSWTNLDPNGGFDSVFVDVLFGTEPNKTDPAYDMALLALDPVSGQDVTSVTVSAPVDGQTYYWQVNSYIFGDPAEVDYDTGNPDDPNVIKGYLYRFHATSDLPLESVEVGPDMITWSGEPIQLDATVVDDGASELSYLWTASPDYGVVFDPDEYAEDPTVTITIPTGRVPVVNAGFESPELEDGMSIGAIGGSVEGWDQGYYGLTSGTWYLWNGDDGCGVVNPDTKYGYDGQAPEGENIAYITGDGQYWYGLSQTLPITLQPNTTYNVSALVAKPKITTTYYAVELIAGHARIGLIQGTALLGEWAPVSLNLATGPDAVSDPNLVYAGESLKIRLLTTGGNILNFDDVLVTSDPPVSSVSTVTLTLNATDTLGSESDTMTIDVYDDACAAARNGLDLATENPADIVIDCITEIEDFVEMVLTWLDDKTIEAQHKPVGDIYFDDFDGDGLSTLHGTAPDIRPGTETWASEDEWLNDGTNSDGYICALLPFVPLGDNVYQLSATIDVTVGGGDWFALGFTQDNNTKSWIVSVNPVGWIRNRETGASQSYLGPEEEGLVDHATDNVPYDFMMELDTNPELWTVEWFAAPAGQPLVSIRGPEAFTTNPTITNVGFGAFGTAIGSVDNFRLHEGPIPGTDSVDAGSSWNASKGEPFTIDDAVAPAGTYFWTGDPDTDVTITGETTLTPTVTFTGSTTVNPTIIELTLDYNTGSDSDTTKIYIYDDTCLAAIGAGEEFDSGDINTDCKTRLEDFAEMAEDWLVDYELTEPVEKP
jgi:hypothetical protein